MYLAMIQLIGDTRSSVGFTEGGKPDTNPRSTGEIYVT